MTNERQRYDKMINEMEGYDKMTNERQRYDKLIIDMEGNLFPSCIFSFWCEPKT